MSDPQKKQRLARELSEVLETRRQWGLLPEYVWGEQEKGVGSQKTGERREERGTKVDRLKKLREEMGDCRRCPLYQGRTHLVFGEGNSEARLMFVGEGPGRDEDQQGRPFVGRAGQLLDKIIEAMGYKREEVYIANVVKSRPPNNRAPTPEETQACSPFLFEQIRIIQPQVMICLGNVATQTMLATPQGISGLRGRFHPWPSRILIEMKDLKIPPESIQLMPTYHPAYLLRNPDAKKIVWEDMKKVMGVLKKT